MGDYLVKSLTAHSLDLPPQAAKVCAQQQYIQRTLNSCALVIQHTCAGQACMSLKHCLLWPILTIQGLRG